MIRAALAATLTVVACDDASATFDSGAPNDASSGVDHVCTAFCPGNATSVVVDIGCGDAGVIDATFTGSCADASAICSNDPKLVPFKDCREVLVFPATAGTCSVSLSFDDDASFQAQSAITEGPRDTCCTSGILSATPIVDDAACE